MKRINKYKDSEILTKNLQYPKDAEKIRAVLQTEQRGYSAYIEYKIKTGTAICVEHFNPTLKNTKDDSYQNWFAATHKWNLKKGDKRRWQNYQPLLHPTATDFEDRIIYDNNTGCYVAKKEDKEANKLIKYLYLDDSKLAKERVKKINQLTHLFENSEIKIFKDWIIDEKNKDLIDFRRAIETVFNIELN